MSIVWRGETLHEVREVAELLDRSVQQVYSLIAQGRLGRRIGGDGKIRVGESDLDEFFGNSRRGAKASGASRRNNHRAAIEELKKKGL